MFMTCLFSREVWKEVTQGNEGTYKWDKVSLVDFFFGLANRQGNVNI